MANCNVEPLSPMCRVCLKYSANNINIFHKMSSFGKSSTFSTIYSIIMDLVPVHISKNDGLPQVICNDCVIKLDAAFQFRERCIKSDEYLRSLPPINDKDSVSSPHGSTVKCCADCNLEFPRHVDYIEHMKIEHNVNSDHSFQCKICEKIFLIEEALKRHEKLHTDLRPYKCNECSKAFKQKKNLISHQKSHTEGFERPFKCTICAKGFLTRYRMNEHVRTHSGEKPFQCDRCSKTFANKSYLGIHQKSHCNPGGLGCTQCDKTFSSRVRLENHYQIHTGQLQYVCEYCDWAFSCGDQLEEHIKLKHKCDFCELYFLDKSSFDEHMDTHDWNRMEATTPEDMDVTDIKNEQMVVVKTEPFTDIKIEDTAITEHYV